MASTSALSPTATSDQVPTSTTDGVAGPTCTTAVPDQYGHVPIDACNAYYLFYPNFAGNTAFAVLFGLTTLAHLAQAIAYKKKFCWVLLMGATWECVSFCLRVVGARDQQNLAVVISSTLLFLLAPLWINAFVYMVVARLVHYILPAQKLWGCKATWLTRIFVALDVLSFLVQGAGGSMMSNQEPGSQNIMRTGQQVYMIGMGVQGAFIVVFAAMTVAFYRKMTREAREGRNTTRAKILVWVMLAVMTLIMVRIIFRLCEFAPGATIDNPILQNENYAFALDGFPMLLALLLLNASHPGTVLRGPDSEFPRLSRKEKKARKQEKKDEKRLAKEAKNRKKRGIESDGSEVV